METATLGTLLRHLIELLDGAVEQEYRDAGLGYRPRYTPIVRVLMRHGPSSIREIAERAGITHSAASQTVAHMARNGLLEVSTGEDARERLVALSPLAREIVPSVERRWRATEAAARGLEAELGVPLAAVIRNAIQALDRKPFGERIRDNLEENRS
ncbi:MarR family winged helix-turn-helix transcriptional regulator [Sphingomonas sp. MS122]|uniref:MarR family winged helix-turn-helix transcriptional regulator n=1 Tax=Sphingomonas sp. MS122 TaxID=3412683 RepID=UPI003C2F36A7